MKLLNNIYNKSWKNVINASSVDASVISTYKKFYILVFLILFLPGAILWMSEVPSALYNPPRLSLTVLFSDFPTYGVLLTMNVFILIGFVLVGVSRYTVITGVITFVLIILNSSFRYSLGKIDHDILLLVSFLCFSLGNWKSNEENRNGALPIPPETLLAIFIAFGMFTAGCQKALHWIDFDMQYSGFMYWFESGYFNLKRDLFLAPYVLQLSPIIIESFDYFTVIFELAAIPILLSGKKVLWKSWILMACIFHIANILLLNISFTAHFLVYLPFLIPKKMVFEASKKTKLILNGLIVLVASTQLVLMIEGEQIMNYVIKSRWSSLFLGLTLLGFAFVIGVYSLILDLKERKQLKNIEAS